MCHSAYNDAPWQPAGVTDSHACKGLSIENSRSMSHHIDLACVCNGYAKNCTFSRELFEQTGHGSVCIDCAGNRGGPNCDSCKLGFYRLPESKEECLPCGCDPIGKSSIER